MSNEVIQRRCRRSPTGIEDCFGSTGGTGSTGSTGEETEFFFDEISGFPFTIGEGDPLLTLFDVPIVVDDGEQVEVTGEIIFSPNSAAPHSLQGWITVDGVIVPESERTFTTSAVDSSSQLLLQRLLPLTAGAHTVGLAFDLIDGVTVSVSAVSIMGEIA